MTNRSQIKTHELVNWKGRSWALTEFEYRGMNERLEAGAKFLTLPDGSDSKVSVSDIKFFGRRQVSMSDMIDETKMLPQGEKKQYDPLAKGYIKFLAMSVKLALKQGTGTAKVQDKVTDEQRPLINAELKKLGIDFQL
jgi:hypothetical protein